MSFAEMKTAFPRANIDFLAYMSLVKSIPQMWRVALSQRTYHKLSEEQRQECFSIRIDNKQYKISTIRSSHFYFSWLSRNTPSAIANGRPAPAIAMHPTSMV